MNNIIVTGGNGYIGSCFTALAASKVITLPLPRQQPTSGNVPWLYFDIASYESFDLPLDRNVLVHLAANTSAMDFLDIDTEVAAARN